MTRWTLWTTTRRRRDWEVPAIGTQIQLLTLGTDWATGTPTSSTHFDAGSIIHLDGQDTSSCRSMIWDASFMSNSPSLVSSLRLHFRSFRSWSHPCRICDVPEYIQSLPALACDGGKHSRSWVMYTFDRLIRSTEKRRQRAKLPRRKKKKKESWYGDEDPMTKCSVKQVKKYLHYPNFCRPKSVLDCHVCCFSLISVKFTL